MEEEAEEGDTISAKLSSEEEAQGTCEALSTQGRTKSHHWALWAVDSLKHLPSCQHIVRNAHSSQPAVTIHAVMIHALRDHENWFDGC